MKLGGIIQFFKLGLGSVEYYIEGEQKATEQDLDYEVRSIEITEEEGVITVSVFNDTTGNFKVPEELDRAKELLDDLWERLSRESIQWVIADGYDPM